jgi:pilus assembly protein TadC
VSVLPPALGIAWGVCAATPLIGRARGVESTTRAAALGAREERIVRRARHVTLPGSVGRVVESLVARRRARVVAAGLVQELPVVIDLLAVAVSAGCTPYLAVSVASDWAPPATAARLRAVRRSCDLGAGFAEALESEARDTPVLMPLIDALLASDRFGAPVGAALGRLAVEERAALRRRAEARARTVPVKLLFPLVFLVLPAFVLLTVAPALLAGLGRS